MSDDYIKDTLHINAPLTIIIGEKRLNTSRRSRVEKVKAEYVQSEWHGRVPVPLSRPFVQVVIDDMLFAQTEGTIHLSKLDNGTAEIVLPESGVYFVPDFPAETFTSNPV